MLQITNKIVADPNLAIEIRHFTKKFKDFKTVDNIAITVSKGKIHGFIGSNGSGKTTTIKSIIGAIIPTEGKLFIHGMKSASTPAKQIIGYISENAHFSNHLNVYQYLVEMSFLRGLKYRQAKNGTSISKWFNCHCWAL
ncbi:hypothetical protein P344_04680 [Spiroplasma mirum ATCC 29335]|uniref:ABC transporter domain-containing protein n=1 Tax=Spiroplasma mirum ATCC 29335 TaxID=838561 RepID=W6ALU1_9MOLU|nr:MULTISPECIES: ATP-binding cassette domain-containing protein [Spiroplasma]AHI58258.1 hypothetical protein P344_04680 [Spiroplasma mirum ATCC 29335]